MLRQIIFGLLAALLALNSFGCGSTDEDTSKSAKEDETLTEQRFSADKAVLAYAQLYAYGIVEDENMTAANMKQEEIMDIQNQVLMPIVEAFQRFPLSEENVADMTRQYVGKLHRNMNMRATLKKDDPTNPVVELTAITLDNAGAMEIAETDENLQALAQRISEMQAQGLTEEELKANADFQDFAMAAINAYIDEFPLNDEASIEVPCKAIQASDGKTYWTPEDPRVIAKFVSGRN